MAIEHRARPLIVLCLALAWPMAGRQICFGQTDANQAELLMVRQHLDEIAITFPAQIRKLDDPTVRIFLKLRIATLLWTESDEISNTIAQSLTIRALEELDTERDAVPQLYSEMFRRDLLALLQSNAPETAKRYLSKDIDVAYSLLNSKGKEALAVATLESELAKGWIPDLKLLFFLHRLQTQQPFELGRALSILMSAEERRVGTISIEVFSWLSDFYLKPDIQPDLKRRFLLAAVNSTKVSYTLLDGKDLNQTYNLLVAIIPHVKSLTPSLYPQAAAQLSSLMNRVSNARSQSEEVDERIRASSDPLSQTITEARAASDPTLKDELFLQAARLALEKGKLKLSLELATSMSADRDRKKWQEQFLSQLASTAIDKKAPQIASAAIAHIESRSIRIALMQKLTLYFFESNDLLKARELLDDTLKTINSVEGRTEKSLALLRLLPLIAKVNNETVAAIGEQTVKSINSIPSPDNKMDKTVLNDYVQKTLMPLTWQALPIFQSMAERDEILTLDLVNGIQVREIRTSGLLGVAIAKLVSAKNTANEKRIKKRAYNSQPH